MRGNSSANIAREISADSSESHINSVYLNIKVCNKGRLILVVSARSRTVDNKNKMLQPLLLCMNFALSPFFFMRKLYYISKGCFLL